MVRAFFVGMSIFFSTLLMGMERPVEIESDMSLLKMSMPIVARYCDLRSVRCLMRTCWHCNVAYDVSKICPFIKQFKCSTCVCAELSRNYYLCSRALAHCAKKSNSDMFGHLFVLHRGVRIAYALDSDKSSVDKMMYRYNKDYGTQKNAEVSFNELVLDVFDANDADGLKTVFKGRELYIPHESSASVLKHICTMGDADLLFKYSASYGHQNGPNTLKWIIKYGSFSIVQALIYNGSLQVQDIGKNGMTAVHFAVLYDKCDSMKVLLGHDFLVDPIDDRGRTPLHYAAKKSNVAAVKILLEHNSNAHRVDRDGKTAIDCIPFGKTKIAKFMGEDASPRVYRNKAVLKLLKDSTKV